jgi:hypothetical protein
MKLCVTLALAVLLAGCSGAASDQAACAAGILRDQLPDWTASAASPDLGEQGFVLSREGNVVGVLFVTPLIAGERTDGANNKILWIMKEPRNGSVLHIDAHLVGDNTAGGSYDLPPNSSPGEIYPSIIDVPEPGCWRLNLSWDGNNATVDLEYDQG